MRCNICVSRVAVVCLCLLLGFLGLMPGDATADDSQAPIGKAKIFQRTLDNGLSVLIRENHSASVVAVRIYVKTGSIYEKEFAGSGISHYYEHLVAGGTTNKRTEEESRKLLQQIGNVSNAYTSNDHTCYYITTTATHFDTALDLLSDWVMNCALKLEEVEREKGVILREIGRGRDDPRRAMYRLLYQTMFTKHPIRLPVIGYEENFRRITHEDLVSYYKQHYVPNNMVISIAGDIDTAKTFEKIEEAFRSFKRGVLEPYALPGEPRQTGPRWIEKDMPVGNARLLMGFHTVELTHPDLYPLDLMSFALSQGRSSRLYRRIKEEKQLVHSISSWSSTPSYGGGAFIVSAVLDYDKVPAAVEAIKEEIYALREELFTDDEIARAKTQKISEHVFSNQTAESQASNMGRDMISAADPHFGESYVTNIQNVTAQDIRDVSNRYFYDDNLTVSVLKPAVADTAETTSAVQETKIGKVHKYTLSNGAVLLVKKNPTVPIVAIQAHFKGGVRLESDENNGISSMVSNMLLKGTTNRNAEEISREIESRGGTIGTESGNDSFNCSVEVLKDDLKIGLDVLADVLMNPTFPEDELAKEKTVTLAAIQRIDDHWQSEIMEVFRKEFYGEHPYRLNPLGGVETVEGITRDDLRAFYKKWCVPDNMVLAVFGDVEPEKVLVEVEKAFKGFERGGSESPKIAPPSVLQEDKEKFKAGAKQEVSVVLGFPGCSADSSDRFALTVLDAVSSGIGYPSGWLHTALRGDNDLVYFVHAIHRMGIDPGSFFILLQTSPGSYEQVIAIVREILEKAKTERVSEEELALAKQQAILAEEIFVQTNGSQARQAALNELYGLGYDFMDSYAEKINAVTAEDVQRVAKKYLNHSALVVVKPDKE